MQAELVTSIGQGSRSEYFSAIIEALGVPDFEAEDVLLYNRDCLSAMKLIPKGTFDLTLTSPPYNIGKEYEQVLQLDDYLAWSKRWVAEVFRITKDNGAFWLNLGYVPVAGRGKAVPLAYLMWQISPFYLNQEVVWHYGAGVATKNSFSPRNEKFLWFIKSASAYTFNLDAVRDKNVKYPFQKKGGRLKCNPNGKNPTDVWEFPKVTSGKDRSSVERTSHPAQFPIAVVDRIILSCSSHGNVVLDPFLGSGTVAEAALNAGRQFVGFEIRKDYFEIAADRITNYLEMRQLRERQSYLPL